MGDAETGDNGDGGAGGAEEDDVGDATKVGLAGGEAGVEMETVPRVTDGEEIMNSGKWIRVQNCTQQEREGRLNHGLEWRKLSRKTVEDNRLGISNEQSNSSNNRTLGHEKKEGDTRTGGTWKGRR